MKTLKLALDWTPNTNHIGFFVANALGFYEEVGLEVELLNPQQDNYAVTPAKKVELGDADMALCPMESIISYRTKSQAFDAVALATIFQEDLSAIVVLKDADIQRPSDLDGKSYASYKARYEDEIVRQIIVNDGGQGNLELTYPDKLGIWETLLTKKYDAIWIFKNWEGVHAQAKGVQLREFNLADYGIPYGYSPVIMASKAKVDTDKASFEAFLAATKKGFLYAMEHAKEAVLHLEPHVSKADADIDLLQGQQLSIPAYGASKTWGQMEKARVEAFLKWLKDKGLEDAELTFEDLVYPNLAF